MNHMPLRSLTGVAQVRRPTQRALAKQRTREKILASAKALIAHWVGSNAGMFMRIDVPGESGLSNWLEELGLACVDNVVTMVRGAPLKPAAGFRVFGAVNQALG